MAVALTLEALEVLDAIERKGSFAGAAALLNRVPSAISYSVQKLEQDLGVSLFQKQGRRAVLTPAGELLVSRGRELLLAADDLASATQQTATGWEPRLRIALDTVVQIELLLPLLAKLYNKQPGIEIVIREEVLGGTWEALLENRVDLLVGGISTLPGHYLPGHRGIRCETWCKVEQVFVAAANHPIVQAPQPLSNDTIQQYRGVVVSDTSRNYAPLSRGVFAQRSFLYVPSMRHKLLAHCEGLGVGFVPLTMAQPYLESGQLVVLELEEQAQNEPLQIAWKVSNRGRAVHWFIEQLLALP